MAALCDFVRETSTAVKKSCSFITTVHLTRMPSATIEPVRSKTAFSD